MRIRVSLVIPFAAVLMLAGCITVSAAPPQASPSASGTTPASAAPSPTTPSEVFAPGAPAGQCLTANLAATITEIDASAGHLHAQLLFKNNGPSCVLDGFPVVQVVQAGANVGPIAQEDASVTSAPITLASGGTVVALLTSVNIGTDGGPLGDSCPTIQGSGYNITPPHSLTPIPVSVDGVAACTNGTVWMTVGPVTAP